MPIFINGGKGFDKLTASAREPLSVMTEATSMATPANKLVHLRYTFGHIQKKNITYAHIATTAAHKQVTSRIIS